MNDVVYRSISLSLAFFNSRSSSAFLSARARLESFSYKQPQHETAIARQGNRAVAERGDVRNCRLLHKAY